VMVYGLAALLGLGTTRAAAAQAAVTGLLSDASAVTKVETAHRRKRIGMPAGNLRPVNPFGRPFNDRPRHQQREGGARGEDDGEATEHHAGSVWRARRKEVRRLPRPASRW